MEKLKQASQSYYKSGLFTDFTIISDGEEYKIHRCYVAPHSKYFERLFASSFAESSDGKVELKEDLPEAVECMIEYFYQHDYESPFPSATLEILNATPTASEPEKEIISTDDQGSKTTNSGDNSAVESGNGEIATIEDVDVCARQPCFDIQLHAHVYAVAEKYDAPGLKELALTEFKRAAVSAMTSKTALLATACTLYNHISVAESDRTLHTVLLDLYIVRGHVVPGSDDISGGLSKDDLQFLVAECPDFVTDLTMKLISGFKGEMWTYCTQCGKRLQIKCLTESGHPTSQLPTHKSGLFGKVVMYCSNTAITESAEVLASVKVEKFW